MSAHDRWLANYSRSEEQVWCSNPKCQNFDDGATVLYESEYGQGTYSPEECPECHSEWLDDKPEREDDDDDV